MLGYIFVGLLQRNVTHDRFTDSANMSGETLLKLQIWCLFSAVVTRVCPILTLPLSLRQEEQGDERREDQSMKCVGSHNLFFLVLFLLVSCSFCRNPHS